jgi:sterol desaturase/sphingolipid hydroxylase (fatty acid hydroxylase superfamily)
MDWVSDIVSFLLFPLFYLARNSSQYYLPTYLGAAFTAAAFYLVWRRGRRPGASRLMRFLLPERLYRHPSSRLDMKLVAFGLYFVGVQGLLVYWLVPESVDLTGSLLARSFGPGTAGGTPSLVVSLFVALFSFLAVEFGYWYSHYLMHRVPWLWEFHKVHHSAEVMTPLTEWRQHPIELMLFPALMTLANSLIVSPAIWYFGPEALVLPLGFANLFYMVFWYTILHLRHSQVPIMATGWLGCLVQTPAHHQIHHSTDPKHYDTNLGYCLSLWDWAFGTLSMPVKGQKLNYGLGHRDTALETVLGSVVTPFGRAAAIIARKFGRRPRGAAVTPPAE